MLSWVLAARPPGLDADHVRSVCRGRVSLLGLTRVLITGMSSTGKSTALAELARRVHRVVDADLPCLEYRARLARWIRCGAVLARVGDERGAPPSTSPNCGSSQDAPLIKAASCRRVDSYRRLKPAAISPRL